MSRNGAKQLLIDYRLSQITSSPAAPSRLRATLSCKGNEKDPPADAGGLEIWSSQSELAEENGPKRVSLQSTNKILAAS